MEDAKKRQAERDDKLRKTTPREVLRELQVGNKRFQAKRSEMPPMSLVQRNNLINGQAPKVMVIGCSDSRVPTETIFDQGIGDVFVCRHAASQVGERVLGTAEYGVYHLGIKLIVVMSHQGCGALRAARSPLSVIKNEPPRLRTMLLGLHVELDRCSDALDAIADPYERDKQTALVNSQAQVRTILRSTALRKKVDAGEILVLAAYYSITTGEVEFAEVDPSSVPMDDGAGDAPTRGYSIPIPTISNGGGMTQPSRGWCAAPRMHPPAPLVSDYDQLYIWTHNGVRPSDVLEPRRPPADILSELKEGNHRFWTGAPVGITSQPPPASTAGRRPKCMVLGCADSRVPIEIVFDQSAGDIYVARNAGNLWTASAAASVELAVYHLGVQLIVVLGHQACGAVKASRMTVAQIDAQTGKLRDMLHDMRESIEYCFETLDHIQDANARDREQVIANAQQQVRKILREPAVRSKVDSGELMVVAGFYEITSGIVDFVELPKEAYPTRNTWALPWSAGATEHGPRMVMSEPPAEDVFSTMFGSSGVVGGRSMTNL